MGVPTISVWPSVFPSLTYAQTFEPALPFLFCMNMFCGTRPCVASMIARPMRSPPAPTPEWVTISTCFVGTHPSVSAALPEAAGAAC